MDDRRDVLVSAATSAMRHPAAGAGTSLGHAAWLDLDEAGRLEVYTETLAQREIEAALESEGRSSTVLAVLARIGG